MCSRDIKPRGNQKKQRSPEGREHEEALCRRLELTSKGLQRKECEWREICENSVELIKKVLLCFHSLGAWRLFDLEQQCSKYGPGIPGVCLCDPFQESNEGKIILQVLITVQLCFPEVT